MSNVQQLIFWTVVVALLTLIFGRFFPNPGQAFFFVSMLLPVIVGTAYFFNYFLVPRYLHSHRHAEFVLYFIYTLIISVYLEMVVLTFAFIYLANYTYETSTPSPPISSCWWRYYI